MARGWTANEAEQEAVAYERWAEEFLNELQAQIDYARACFRGDDGTGDSPYDAMQAIKTLVNDEERGIPV